MLKIILYAKGTSEKRRSFSGNPAVSGRKGVKPEKGGEDPGGNWGKSAACLTSQEEEKEGAKESWEGERKRVKSDNNRLLWGGSKGCGSHRRGRGGDGEKKKKKKIIRRVKSRTKLGEIH